MFKRGFRTTSLSNTVRVLHWFNPRTYKQRSHPQRGTRKEEQVYGPLLGFCCVTTCQKICTFSRKPAMCVTGFVHIILVTPLVACHVTQDDCHLGFYRKIVTIKKWPKLKFLMLKMTLKVVGGYLLARRLRFINRIFGK